MAFQIEQTMGTPYPLGVSATENGVNIALDIPCKRECGIVIFYKNMNSMKIPFHKHNQTGNLYTVLLKGLQLDEFVYQIYADDKTVKDPYARQVKDNRKWGVYQKGNKQYTYICQKQAFDWEEDIQLAIPYESSIFYGLHVRGFTKHTSSRVKSKGTFAGVTEKIPYLKSLGITAVVCMPFYDFDEIIINREYQEITENIKPFLEKKKETWEYKVNYWGFADAQYFAPKASFAQNADAAYECKHMIKQLHKNGIECIMRIYFKEQFPQTFVYEVLKYWVMEYHVDGFHLMGMNLPMELLINDPLLGKTKLMGEYISEDQVYKKNRSYGFKNVAMINDEFMVQARKYLKGDEGMLSTMAMLLRKNPEVIKRVNYMTSYQGFTLMDLVSYDRKHNEANGEENRDGCEYNFSWNCGIEGKTKKKAVMSLRISQIKNALSFLFLSQGVPMIQAGDEFGFSSGGNNNPYCQDNATTWLNWNLVQTNDEILQFFKELIQLRKAHPILHKEEEMRVIDYISCGYPDLSYHGDEAWKPQFDYYNRHMGVLYCGKYALIDKKTEDNFIFVAFNLHWMEHDFAIPKLPSKMKWFKVLDTGISMAENIEAEVPIKEQEMITVPKRTIWVLIGK